MRIPRTLLIAAFSVVAGAGSIGGKVQDPLPYPPGTYTWYTDDLHLYQTGYVIYECNGARHGPYGYMTFYEVYEPLNC